MIIYNPNIICAEDRARMWLLDGAEKRGTPETQGDPRGTLHLPSTSVCDKRISSLMKMSTYFGRLTWDAGSSSKGRGMHISCFLSDDPRIGLLRILRRVPVLSLVAERIHCIAACEDVSENLHGRLPRLCV